MLVVLASAHDKAAQSLVSAWAPWGAVLCTPEDLTSPGWRFQVSTPLEGAARIGGEIVPVGRIRGVLTRLPAVNPSELETIRITDRSYVAAEMTAFLIAFLSALPVRVLNRPCPGSISGPSWRPEQWIRAAALAGIPIMPARRSVRLASSNPPQTEPAAEVTIVGDHVIGAVDARLADWSCKLAREAGVGMLAAGFARRGDGYVLSGVNPSPELNTREKRDAARDYLAGGPVGVRV